MTTKVIPGMLIAMVAADDVAREASARIAKALREAVASRGRATLALSGGETPRATYAKLAAETGVDWTKIDVFFVDERAVAATSERSNYRMVKEALLDPAKVPADLVHRMDGAAKDLTQAAAEYEKLLRSKAAKGARTPELDVIVLGVGDDGHTASLFPGDGTVDVVDKLAMAIPAKGEREARITLTVPVLEQARAAFVLAVGAKKTPALERVWAVTGSLSDTPARAIRGIRGSIMWVIDKAAGGMG
jgi:6-phosphogluconolactonase